MRAVMVGDDLWSDVEGAQRAGLQGWLVRTGKFREDTLRGTGITPQPHPAQRGRAVPVSRMAVIFRAPVPLECGCRSGCVLPLLVACLPAVLSAQTAPSIRSRRPRAR